MTEHGGARRDREGVLQAEIALLFILQYSEGQVMERAMRQDDQVPAAPDLLREGLDQKVVEMTRVFGNGELP